MALNNRDFRERLRFIANRLRERLWIKPLLFCLVSVGAVFIAKETDQTSLSHISPDISVDSVETLLSIMAASMLVIATFAVGSMVAAYSSTSNTATPRAFTLVIADDVSQNALSVFIGAFIFSIVALTASKNGYFETASRFTLFVLTLLVFALVIITFVRWVDRIARLGRMKPTITTVESATAAALGRRKRAPTLEGAPLASELDNAQPVFASSVGYVQQIDMGLLQDVASAEDFRISVAALPGTFATHDRPLAYICGSKGNPDIAKVKTAFVIGDERKFDDDPRFGLIVLSEIAGRALSPAVNDPGTAIDIIGTFVRLFSVYLEPTPENSNSAPIHDRVEVPEISVADMFDDAFTVIGRDGAGLIEVAIRLQKALHALASGGDGRGRQAAINQASIALMRCEKALALDYEIEAVEKLARAIKNIQ